MGEQLDRSVEWVQAALDRTPWASVGLLIATIAAIVLAYPVARLLRSNPIIVGMLLGAVGFALVFTLTPHLGEVYNAGQCYMRFSQPTRADLVAPSDVSLNILLFIPTGILVMLLRPAWAVMLGIAIAIMIPVAIEYIQLTQTQLGRTCSFLDIATNELGLLAGLAVGAIIRIAWEIVRALTHKVRA